jgi:hypothetical protein
MTLAIFDIDGTLVEGSTERRFWRYLLKRGHQGPRQVLAYLLFWLRYLPVYGRLTRKKNKAYLYKPRPRACAVAAASSPRDLPRLYAPAVQRSEPCGAAIPSCSCPAPADRQGARPRAGGPRARHDCRDATTAPLGPPTCIRSASGSVRRCGRDRPGETSAYGDSQHDSTCCRPSSVAVMPDQPLLETARGNRWHIIRSRNPTCCRGAHKHARRPLASRSSGAPREDAVGLV